MRDEFKYVIMIACGVAGTLIEGNGTYHTESNALFSDAVHMFADSVTPALGFWALITLHKHRAEKIENAIVRVNFVFLLTMAVIIAFRGAWHLAYPIPNPGWNILPYAIIGAVLNGIQYYFSLGLKDAHAHTHTGESQIAHFKADFLASGLVVVSALLVWLTEMTQIDALISLAVGGIIFNMASELRHTKEHRH